MSGILKMFTAIKYFPKNYKVIVILGDDVTKLRVHGIGTITVGIQNKLIELHDVLYFPDTSDTLCYIIEHSCQTDLSFLIKNGATTVRFPTLTLLANTHKEIILDDYLPSKDQHSQPDYTNLPNYFKNITVRLIHDKAATSTRSTDDSASYNIHNVEQVSIKIDETNKISTGVYVHFSQGSFVFLASRSSMATKQGIMVPTGTIYCDYTGKISVLFHNQSKTTLSIKEGMHIAKPLIFQVSTPTLHMTQSELFTSRG